LWSRSPTEHRPAQTLKGVAEDMGSLIKKRRKKIRKHKLKKRRRANRHKKRERYKV
jgi:hypothetical protein